MTRLIGPAIVAIAIVLSLASPAGARPKPRPSLTAADQSFELFGTSFCVQSSEPGTRCDVALPERAMTIAPPLQEHRRRVKIFGVTFCSEAETTGPACDVVWQDPQPAQPWRDAPEIRTADVMPRQR